VEEETQLNQFQKELFQVALEETIGASTGMYSIQKVNKNARKVNKELKKKANVIWSDWGDRRNYDSVYSCMIPYSNRKIRVGSKYQVTQIPQFRESTVAQVRKFPEGPKLMD